MIRINLLPHRAEKRRARQNEFIAFSVLAVLLGLLVVGVVHLVIGGKIDYQERRNNYLKQEIAVLDAQIADIRQLREQSNSLMARKTVVEDLQSTRADVVHLLDQMLHLLPEGVYIKSIKQTGKQINLIGYAQSNGRVSTLMRSIEDSPWLDSPVLVDIHTSLANNVRTNEFSLNFNVTHPEAAKSADEKHGGNS
ncbi:Fimbrial assembly family protein [Ferriphaselus amnicola]|uniref:Fimbrial assembly family protein n=1 Tax=Ferriphaselus amnicola TaxID=1188319 RepID=A0A2Z6GFS1_9PROT|nr:PilN domain-containing protein [Ferriphaselus amnicola]BBE52005.1 Fimbrial assembly family protein [Ferriphaselus amnicola]